LNRGSTHWAVICIGAPAVFALQLGVAAETLDVRSAAIPLTASATAPATGASDLTRLIPSIRRHLMSRGG